MKKNSNTILVILAIYVLITNAYVFMNSSDSIEKLGIGCSILFIVLLLLSRLKKKQ